MAEYWTEVQILFLWMSSGCISRCPTEMMGILCSSWCRNGAQDVQCSNFFLIPEWNLVIKGIALYTYSSFSLQFWLQAFPLIQRSIEDMITEFFLQLQPLRERLCGRAEKLSSVKTNCLHTSLLVYIINNLDSYSSPYHIAWKLCSCITAVFLFTSQFQSWNGFWSKKPAFTCHLLLTSV